VIDGRALLFDVGNTRLKWGVLERDRIARTGSITHATLQESGFNALTTRLPRKVDQILVSNVAGASFATRLAGVMGIHCDTDVHFARSEKSAYGITNSYRQPRRLGVDRWVAMIGARAELRGAICIVDVGTAVTIDALDKDGQHLGGQILPGLQLMVSALEKDTSDIGGPGRMQKNPGSGIQMFGKNTSTATQNGSLSAVCGAVERAVKTMRAEGFRPKIVLTGGDASRILKQLDGNVLHRPNLVLQGLAFILQSKL
jgi:type III pantothenate kinase